MTWRRHLCCASKMTWTIKHSLLRTFVIGLLLLALLFSLFLFFSPQEWLLGRTVHRDAPLAYIVNSSLWSMLKDSALVVAFKSSVNISAQQAEPANTGRSLDQVLGLGDTMSANKSLQEEMDTGGKSSTQPYRYLLNEPLKCKDSTPFLLIMVASEPREVEARNAVRQTWGNASAAPEVKFIQLFLLGVNKYTVQNRIEEESHKHHDIIQLDYQDTYNNLTLKILSGMNWVVTYCPQVSYVMKTDTDMFVNTEYLIQRVLQPDLPPKRKYFTGFMMINCTPVRNKDSKWYMSPEEYPGERYPLFCSGTGYVFSGDLAELIYQTSLSIPRLHLEDVYVGVCLAKLGIKPQAPTSSGLFNNWYVPFTSCRYSHIVTSHQVRPANLIKYWNHLQSNKHNPCGNRKKRR